MRVLLVEDDNSTRLLLEGILRQEGYQVRAFAAAEPAFSACRQGIFDIVVLDDALAVRHTIVAGQPLYTA